VNGYEYNALHSLNDYDIIANSIDRPILPTLRKREISIDGKHGTYSFDDNTYENRPITVEIKYIGESFNALRLHMRDISAWLSQTTYKKLIFDDEPDKYYLAKIYSAVSLELFWKLGKATIQFECQPFALYVESSGDDLAWGDDVPWGSEFTWDNVDFHTIKL
jgi:predicted phage tail component-like protein